MMDKQEDKYEFKKKGSNEYEFIYKAADFVRVETVGKAKVKETYDSALSYRLQILQALNKLNKQIKENDMFEKEPSDELKEWMRLAEDAKKYESLNKFLNDKARLQEDLAKVELQIRDIELVIPEFGRDKGSK